MHGGAHRLTFGQFRQPHKTPRSTIFVSNMWYLLCVLLCSNFIHFFHVGIEEETNYSPRISRTHPIVYNLYHHVCNYYYFKDRENKKEDMIRVGIVSFRATPLASPRVYVVYLIILIYFLNNYSQPFNSRSS